jgi:hypothetical protein
MTNDSKGKAGSWFRKRFFGESFCRWSQHTGSLAHQQNRAKALQYRQKEETKLHQEHWTHQQNRAKALQYRQKEETKLRLAIPHHRFYPQLGFVSRQT